MKKYFILLIYVSLIFYSCDKDKDKDKIEKNNSAEENLSIVNNENKEKSEKKFSTKAIKVSFNKGSTEVVLNGVINGFGSTISYEFEAVKGQTLNAQVKAKSDSGNIRFNQIIDPQGKANGPFSDFITYLMNESGEWKLIVGENMMSGEPWSGDYILTIDIK